MIKKKVEFQMDLFEHYKYDILVQAWANYGLGAVCGPLKLSNLALQTF